MAHVLKHIAKRRKKATTVMKSERELVDEMIKNVPLMKTAEEQKKVDKEYLSKVRNEVAKQKILSGGKLKKKVSKVRDDAVKKVNEEQNIADKLYQAKQKETLVNSNRVNDRQRKLLDDMEKNSPYNKRMLHERAKWIKSGCTEETCPLTSSHYDPIQEPRQPEIPASVNTNQPGPLPGMRPTMGGAGGMVPPPAGKGSGAMGIIMPLYTVGIVVFFVYTIMKVLFKKGSDDDKAPKLKDFGLDPEYRKYVFAEEYLDNQNISQKSQYRREQREESRQRKKMHEVPDTKIETKNLYVPKGYLSKDDSFDDEDINEILKDIEQIGGLTYEEAMAESEPARTSKNNKQQKKNPSIDHLIDSDIKTKNLLHFLRRNLGYSNIEDSELKRLTDLCELAQNAVYQRINDNTIDEEQEEEEDPLIENDYLDEEQVDNDYINDEEIENDYLNNIDEEEQKVAICYKDDYVNDGLIENNYLKYVDEEEKNLDEIENDSVNNGLIENDYLKYIDKDEQNINISYREHDELKDDDQENEYQVTQNDYIDTYNNAPEETEQVQLNVIYQEEECSNYKEINISEENMKNHNVLTATFCKGDEVLSTTEDLKSQDDKKVESDLNDIDHEQQNIDLSYRDNLLKNYGLENYYQISQKNYNDTGNNKQEGNEKYKISEENLNRLQEIIEKDTSVDKEPWKNECDKKDEQMDHLRQRLEDTELAMERLMNQMGSVTDKLTAAKITEVLSQAQAQAKILKNEENSASSKGSSPDMEEYEVINKEGVDQKASKKESKQSSPSPSTKTNEECPKTTSAPKETVEETKTETENKEPESTSTTITSAEEEVKEMPITSHSEEDDDTPKNTINTHESLSPNSPPPTQENSNTDKVENNITDTVDTDQSKKENLITEKLSSEQSKKENLVSEKLSSDQSKEENLVSEKLSCKDVSSSKLVSDDEGKSIGKVEE